MNIINKILLTLSVSFFSISLYGQVSVANFKVLDKYLQDGKILIKNGSQSTQIEIELMFSTFRDNAGNPKSGKVQTKLVTKNANDNVVELTDWKEVLSSEFVKNNVYLTKTYTLSINKSLLTNRSINLLQQQPGGAPTQAGKSYEYIIETPPLVIPEITSNTISMAGNIDFFNDLTVSASQPSGGVGVYDFVWEIVDNESLVVNASFEGISSSINLWKKNNSDYQPINYFLNRSNLYLRRKIISGSSVSYSNKILIYNYDNANKNNLSVKVQGRVYKNLGSQIIEKVDAEIDLARLIPDRYFLKFEANNSNAETTFRIENPVVGVRYKWYYYAYKTYGNVEGTSFVSPVYIQGNISPGQYYLRIIGNDGSSNSFALNTRY